MPCFPTFHPPLPTLFHLAYRCFLLARPCSPTFLPGKSRRDSLSVGLTIIPALGRQRPEDHEFQASLDSCKTLC